MAACGWSSAPGCPRCRERGPWHRTLSQDKPPPQWALAQELQKAGTQGQHHCGPRWVEQPDRLRAAQSGQPPTQRSSEPGVGWEALPARPPAHPPARPLTRAPLCGCGCGQQVAARSHRRRPCRQPRKRRRAPRAPVGVGGGMGGPGRARVRHTQSRGCGMKGPILPGLALPSRPGQHVVRWSSPHHRPQASAWPRPGQCLGLETQSWF